MPILSLNQFCQNQEIIVAYGYIFQLYVDLEAKGSKVKNTLTDKIHTSMMFF